MKRKTLLSLIVVSISLFGFTASSLHAENQQFVTIGTGGVTGVYYPTGGAIARLLNKGKAEHGIRAVVESTGGSVYNCNALANGDLDFGVVQSDVQYQAYNGQGAFEESGANQKLRSVFSLHAEPYTVVSRKDANIKNFQDLVGKRFNAGNPGSGQAMTTKVLLEAMDWDADKFKLLTDLKASEHALALVDNKIDAFAYTVGHPNGSIKEASSSADTVLVNVDGPAVEQLVSENSYYRFVTIPGGMYKGSDDDTNTFGVGATFVSSTDVSDDVVYHLVKAVFDNFERFKKLHPAFRDLNKEDMVKESLTAPLHEGAKRYYKEAGLL